MKIQSPMFPVFLFFFNINLRVEREQIGLIIMHLHEVQRLRKIKDERVTLTLGRTSGDGCHSPKVLLSFLLEYKISAPDVFSSCSFIPPAHFQLSSVMVSF